MEQPIRNIELIKIFANAVVVWFVVMDIFPLTEIQQGATLTLVVSGINAAGAWFQNRQTTPLADPRDVDGGVLVKPGGAPPVRVAERAAAERGRV